MVDSLRKKGYRLLCADVSGPARVDFSNIGPVIIALGNEGSGISAPVLDRADASFSIPMNHTAVESINVAVSGAITLFSVFRGLRWE